MEVPWALTSAIGEVEAQRPALAHQADVQVGEPHSTGEQHQQQQQLELLANLLHREPQHRPGSIAGPARPAPALALRGAGPQPPAASLQGSAARGDPGGRPGALPPARS